MLIVHNTRKSGRPALNRTQAQSDHIVSAFENYEQHSGAVSVQPLTAISPYSTMHEDICNLAEDKRVALIIVPFHKQQTIDGGMEATNPAFRTVNQNVLANAPCSVGILVDRGLGATARAASSHVTHNVVVLFFGGPDDREALAYASRMSENPTVNLTVIRFLPGEEAKGWQQENESKDNGMNVVTDNDRERQIDDDVITDFRMKTANDESVVYMEKTTNDGEETVSTIRSLDNIHDLYIVGRGQGTVSPLTAGLTDWSECPELGPIGDLLASSDFAVTVSVLVVQQYVGMGLQGDGVATPDSPAQQQPDQQFDPELRLFLSSLQLDDAGAGGAVGVADRISDVSVVVDTSTHISLQVCFGKFSPKTILCSFISSRSCLTVNTHKTTCNTISQPCTGTQHHPLLAYSNSEQTCINFFSSSINCKP